MRPRVAFLVNGDPASAMAERAESFAARIKDRFECRLIHREPKAAKWRSAMQMLRRVLEWRPDVCYVLDLAAAGVLCAGLYRRRIGAPFVVDTGDAVVELGQALGRSWFGVQATRSLETFAIRAAAEVVVRGSYHRELLAARGVHATFIPDGVSVAQFAPVKEELPSAHDPLVIGLVGSSIWVPRRQTCYGWELVELIGLLRSRLRRPVRGVLVGDGTGIEVLRRRAVETGVVDAIEFAGRAPYSALPAQIHRFNICLSTQTNDVVGNVRTTGKLPLYLAAGRFVLASAVGEAARILPSEMLVEFNGESDPDYPRKLADRIERLMISGEPFGLRNDSIALAREHFEYDRLSPRVETVLESALGKSNRRPVTERSTHDGKAVPASR
jgi:hypothetical protein